MLVVYNLEELASAIANLTYLDLGYTRVSTEKTTQDSSVKRQLEDFKDEGCNVAIVERESGTSIKKRLLYQEIIKLVKEQKIIKIRVDESHRLNRNDAETLYFERLCKINHVPLLYLKQPELNANTYRAEELRRQKAIEAASYSRLVSLNVKKGIERDKKNLKPLSRIPTFGYRFNSDRYYEIDWAKADLSNVLGRDRNTGKLYASGELALFVIEAFLKHESQSQAFKHFKLLLDRLEIVNEQLFLKVKKKQQSWLNNWIKDPTIRGCIAYNRYSQTYKGAKLEQVVQKKNPPEEWEIHPNCHEALMDEAEWRQAQTIFSNNRNKGWATSNARRDKTRPAPLSKLLRCNKCKLTFVAPYSGNRTRSYRCCGKRSYFCEEGKIGEKTLVKSLISKIVQQAEELTEILYLSKTGQKDSRSDRIIELQKEADNLLLLHRTSGRQSYLATYQEVTAEIKTINLAIDKDSTNFEEKQKVLKALQDNDFWDSMTRIELHDYLKAIVRVAWIENKQVVAVELSL